MSHSVLIITAVFGAGALCGVIWLIARLLRRRSFATYQKSYPPTPADIQPRFFAEAEAANAAFTQALISPQPAKRLEDAANGDSDRAD